MKALEILTQKTYSGESVADISRSVWGPKASLKEESADFTDQDYTMYEITLDGQTVGHLKVDDDKEVSAFKPVRMAGHASLILNVTSEVKKLGLGPGDWVRVTLAPADPQQKTK